MIASKIEPLGSLDKPIPNIESIIIDPLLTNFLSGSFFFILIPSFFANYFNCFEAPLLSINSIQFIL